jgi:hypothetical protein
MSSEKTLGVMVQEALDSATTEERMRARVEKHVEELVTRTLSDAMNTWSDVGKSIKNAVQDSLRVGDGLNIPSYGHVVSEMLSAQIQARVSEVVAAKLQEDMEGLLKLAPKRVKLSKLIADLLGDDEYDPCDCDGPSEIGLEIEQGMYQSCWLLINKDGKPDKPHNADIRVLIAVTNEKSKYAYGDVIKGTIRLGHVSGADLKKNLAFGWGSDFSKKRRDFGAWFGLEQKFLAMYACGTVIELDEDACVLSRHVLEAAP